MMKHLKKIFTSLVMFLLCTVNAFSEERVTALHYYQEADSIVHTIYNEPALLEIICDSIDLSGKAVTWSYLYDSLKITINYDTTICEPGFYWLTGMAAIQSFVLDSDSAMSIAEKNGGTDFRNYFTDYTITEGLGQASGSPLATWYIVYRASAAYLSFDVDACNGRILYIYDSYVKVESKSSSFVLYQNYPNPFNNATNINFSIPKLTNVKVSIYNLIGEEIATLVDEQLPTGLHSVSFKSHGLASGLYYYKLETPEYIDTKKLIIQN